MRSVFSRLVGCAVFVAASCFGPVFAASAEEPISEVAAPRTVRLRVLGLFAPSRVEDLRTVAAQLEDASLQEVDYENAQAVFAIVPDKALKDVEDDKLPERIDQALRNVSRSTFSAAPLGRTPRQELSDLEIGVAGLDCMGCAYAAYQAICRIDGVERATVSFREGRVVARIDPKKTERAALEAALKQKEVDVLAN